MNNGTRRSLCAGVAGIILALTPFHLAAQPGGDGAAKRSERLDAVLRKAGTSGMKTLPVIVKVDSASRQTVRKAMKDLGFKVRREHGGISAFTLDAPVGMLERIAAIPGVLGVSVDAEISSDLLGLTTTVVPNTSGTLLRDTLGLNNVGVTGRGVTVALIDSGISPVLDLGGRIKAFYDFTRGGIATAPYDDNGHGTHVAGLIGGSGLTSLGLYRGVAPNVSFVGLKVLTAAGGGSTSNLIAAIEFATANKKALGIDVINLSLGHPPYGPAALDPLVQAVQGASRARILVVSSAGNNGIKNSTGLPAFGGISSPGNAPSSLTVGSERTEGTKRRSDDTAGAWSSRGPSWYDGYAKPDILAPGHKMVGAAAPLSMLVLSNPTLLLSSGRYLALTGTSMSAGVVSGLAALVIEANRTAFPYRRALTPNAIKTIFEYTAFTMRDTSGTAVNRLIQGAGMVNGAGAIRLAGVVNPSATTAATRVTGPVEQHDWIDERLSWAQNVIWGDNVVWGEDLVWGENSVWGENTVWSENLVWGENIVWSENFLDPSGAAAQPTDLELAPGDADLTATSAESF